MPIVRRLQGEFANLKLVYNPGRLSSAGRNTALRHATKDVVVVVDGHCHVPDSRYLHNLSLAFAESGADCLGRPQPLDGVVRCKVLGRRECYSVTIAGIGEPAAIRGPGIRNSRRVSHGKPGIGASTRDGDCAFA